MEVENHRSLIFTKIDGESFLILWPEFREGLPDHQILWRVPGGEWNAVDAAGDAREYWCYCGPGFDEGIEVLVDDKAPVLAEIAVPKARLRLEAAQDLEIAYGSCFVGERRSGQVLSYRMISGSFEMLEGEEREIQVSAEVGSLDYVLWETGEFTGQSHAVKFWNEGPTEENWRIVTECGAVFRLTQQEVPAQAFMVAL